MPMLIPSLRRSSSAWGSLKPQDKNAIQDCIKELTMLSGQKADLDEIEKSIANFKLREDQTIGLKSLCAKNECLTFSIDFAISSLPAFETFAVSLLNAMGGETIL